MPRDSAAARAAILAAALTRLKQAGRSACTVEAVARGAHAAKGLVLYHFRSKQHLMREAGERLHAERWSRFAAAVEGHRGPAGWERLWQELVRQNHDGTGPGSLEIARFIPVPDEIDRAFNAALATWLADSGVAASPDSPLAVRAALDGVAVQLALGRPPADLAVAFLALGVALLSAAERASA